MGSVCPFYDSRKEHARILKQGLNLNPNQSQPKLSLIPSQAKKYGLGLASGFGMSCWKSPYENVRFLNNGGSQSKSQRKKVYTWVVTLTNSTDP